MNAGLIFKTFVRRLRLHSIQQRVHMTAVKIRLRLGCLLEPALKIELFQYSGVKNGFFGKIK